MERIQTKKIDFEVIAWGALFIWWGITSLVPTLPEGLGAIGVGLILLGVNLARALSGVPTSSFSMAIGVLALVLGGLELFSVMIDLPFELPIFAILLIVLGLYLLARYWIQSQNK